MYFPEGLENTPFTKGKTEVCNIFKTGRYKLEIMVSWLKPN